MPQRRITLRDIALRLNIDQSTVSLALRNSPRASSAMREKVQRAAAEMGYQPDPMLSALAHYRQAQTEKPVVAELAWINRWSPPETLHRYREFDGYWRGASAAARSYGYHLEPFCTGTDMSLERLLKILHSRNISGVLIPPHPADRNDWATMDCSEFSIVRFGHSVSLPIHAATCDQAEAALQGFQRIHQKGYRRIGFVTHAGAEFSTRFRAGFLFAQENTEGISRIPSLLLRERDPDEDLRHLERWLDRAKPDAIFTTRGDIMKMLARIGARVPHDIGLAVTSVLDCDADTGIDQHCEEIGVCAVEFLISLIQHGHRGIPLVPRMVTVKGHWVDGTSLPFRE